MVRQLAVLARTPHCPIMPHKTNAFALERESIGLILRRCMDEVAGSNPAGRIYFGGELETGRDGEGDSIWGFTGL